MHWSSTDLRLSFRARDLKDNSVSSVNKSLKYLVVNELVRYSSMSSTGPSLCILWCASEQTWTSCNICLEKQWCVLSVEILRSLYVAALDLVQICSAISEFLDRESERIWKISRGSPDHLPTCLSQLRMPRSFSAGVARPARALSSEYVPMPGPLFTSHEHLFATVTAVHDFRVQSRETRAPAVTSQ